MSLYVVQLNTVDEVPIIRKLEELGLKVYSPKEERCIRQGGQWKRKLYTLFPGYLFVSTEDPMPYYYSVREIPGVVKWLGMYTGRPVALMPGEEVKILWLAKTVPLLPSEAVRYEDGKLEFISGPLKEFADAIQKVDLHDRRAVVELPIGGKKHAIKLCFNVA